MRTQKDTYFRCIDCRATFRLPTRYWHAELQPFTTDLPYAAVQPLCTDCYDRRFMAYSREAMA